MEMCIIFDQITLPLKIYPTEIFVHSQRHIYDHCKLFFDVKRLKATEMSINELCYISSVKYCVVTKIRH